MPTRFKPIFAILSVVALAVTLAVYLYSSWLPARSSGVFDSLPSDTPVQTIQNLETPAIIATPQAAHASPTPGKRLFAGLATATPSLAAAQNPSQAYKIYLPALDVRPEIRLPLARSGLSLSTLLRNVLPGNLQKHLITPTVASPPYP